VAGRAVDAATSREPAARPELVGGAASRARASEDDEPSVLTGALHRHHDARDGEGWYEEEVGHRDEDARQREPPEHAEPAQHPPETGAGRLLDHGRGRGARLGPNAVSWASAWTSVAIRAALYAAADGRTAIGSTSRCSTADQATFRRNASR
jgi:hypothetical protein